MVSAYECDHIEINGVDNSSHLIWFSLDLWSHVIVFLLDRRLLFKKNCVKSYNVHVAPFTWITRSQSSKASNSDAKKFSLCTLFLYQNLWKGKICLITKQLQVNILSKAPYLLQEDKWLLLDQTGSVRYCLSLSQIGNLWALWEPVDCGWGAVGGWNRGLSVLTKDIWGIVGRMPRSDGIHVQGY